jgi:hypothetical protein
MEQTACCEADSDETRQIPFFIWNPMAHYCIHRSPELVRILSRMKPVYTFVLISFKISFNIAI